MFDLKESHGMFTSYNFGAWDGLVFNPVKLEFMRSLMGGILTCLGLWSAGASFLYFEWINVLLMICIFEIIQVNCILSHLVHTRLKKKEKKEGKKKKKPKIELGSCVGCLFGYLFWSLSCCYLQHSAVKICH